MSEAWLCERVDEGWVIRDRERTLVAVVPDELHEQRRKAEIIIAAPRIAERYAQVEDELRTRRKRLEEEFEAARERVRGLVEQLAKEANDLRATIPEIRPAKVCTEKLAELLQELTETQRMAGAIQQQLSVVMAVLAAGRSS